jgi:protein-disulfide isomerase
VHPLACESAAAVRLVRQHSGSRAAMEFGQWLYAHQREVTKDGIRSELDARYRLGTAYLAEYGKLLEGITEDADLGRRLGVASTPTIFIDGVRVSRPVGEMLTAVLQSNIARVSSSPNEGAR